MIIKEDDLKQRLWQLQNILAEKTRALLAVTEERDRLAQENAELLKALETLTAPVNREVFPVDLFCALRMVCLDALTVESLQQKQWYVIELLKGICDGLGEDSESLLNALPDLDRGVKPE